METGAGIWPETCGNHSLPCLTCPASTTLRLTLSPWPGNTSLYSPLQIQPPAGIRSLTCALLPLNLDPSSSVCFLAANSVWCLA